MRPIAIIDQDCTIADTYELIIQRHNELFGTSYSSTNWLPYFGDHTIEEPGITFEHFHEIMAEDGFFRNLKPIRGAKAGLRRLKDAGFDLLIVSRPYRDSKRPYLDKLEWLEEHFPYLTDKFIATGCKEYVDADVLVDDHMPFCRAYNERNPDTWLASLKYPWTDTDLIDIVEPNWYELSNAIIKTIL